MEKVNYSNLKSEKIKFFGLKKGKKLKKPGKLNSLTKKKRYFVRHLLSTHSRFRNWCPPPTTSRNPGLPTATTQGSSAHALKQAPSEESAAVQSISTLCRFCPWKWQPTKRLKNQNLSKFSKKKNKKKPFGHHSKDEMVFS